MKRLFDLKIGKGQEFLLALQNAGLNAKQAESVIVDPVLAEKWVNSLLPIQSVVYSDRFSAFSHLLHPLSIQAPELRRKNSHITRSERVPDSWFDDLDTNSDHVQSVKDLEFFFIVPPGALKKVIEYQVRLIRMSQPNIWASMAFNSQIDDAYLDYDTADISMFAKPGIYRRRINLVSYWDFKNGSCVDQARKQASARGILLAGLAAVGAYAAQDPRLCQKLDGENLPYLDIADLRSGDSGSQAFSMRWDLGNQQVFFDSYGSSGVNRHYGAPSFVKGV